MARDFDEVFKEGRPLAYPLEDYWRAVSGEGDLGFQWSDKPHRIVYDLIACVVYERKRADKNRELYLGLFGRACKAESELAVLAYQEKVISFLYDKYPGAEAEIRSVFG